MLRNLKHIINLIFLAYYEEISERYICLDKEISLSSIKIYNEDDIFIDIKYIRIKY